MAENDKRVTRSQAKSSGRKRKGADENAIFDGDKKESPKKKAKTAAPLLTTGAELRRLVKETKKAKKDKDNTAIERVSPKLAEWITSFGKTEIKQEKDWSDFNIRDKLNHTTLLDNMSVPTLRAVLKRTANIIREKHDIQAIVMQYPCDGIRVYWGTEPSVDSESEDDWEV